jgi:hypothetical protein
MAMRETARSLRAYFVVSAILSGAMNIAALRGSEGLGTVIFLIGVGFALAYLYLGVRLKQLLVSAPQRITGILIAGAAFLVLLLVLGLLSGFQGGLLFQVVLGLLITWYLFVNVKRLAAEARAVQAAV